MLKIYILWINLLLFVNGRIDSMLEEDILEEILYNYNKIARPATNRQPAVNVVLGINLIQIEECDGITLKAMTWLTLSWTDPRLEWSNDDYDIESLTLPSDLVWKPDIVLYNSPSSYPGNAYDPRVYVHYTGSVSWFPPTKIETNCEESEYNPDVIFCYMRFGSWSYHGKSLDVLLGEETIGLDDYIESPDWILLNSTAERIEEKYACCPEPYPYIFYNITLARRQPMKTEITETVLDVPINGTDSGAKKGSKGQKLLNKGVKSLRHRITSVPVKDLTKQDEDDYYYG